MAEQMLNAFKCPHDFVKDYEECKYQSREECVRCKCGQYITLEKIYLGILLNKYELDSLWISVKDRLPTENGKYLVCNVGTAYVKTARFDNTVYGEPGWYNGDNEGDWEERWITHWMPIPKVPKEG